MDVRHGERFAIAQTNRFTAAVRKLLSIKGEEHAVGFGVHLEDERPEHSFIKGEKLWVQWNQVMTGAGPDKGFIAVQNPLGSGVLAVVTGIVIEHDTAGVLMDILFAIGPTGLTGAAMKCRDTRWQNVVSTTVQGAAGAGTIAGGSLLSSMHTPGVNQALDILTHPGFRCGPVILGPGSTIWVAQNVAAAGKVYSATFTGYERSLESGETIPA